MFFFKHNTTTGVVQLYSSVAQSITIVFCPHCTGRQSWLYNTPQLLYYNIDTAPAPVSAEQYVPIIVV